MSSQAARIQKDERIKIRTKDGPMTALFRVIDPTGILELSEDYPPSLVGEVFVPNHTRAKQSKKYATHNKYRGLLEAYRGGKHTVQHGGAHPGAKNGEVQVLDGGIETSRAFVRVSMASGLLTPEEYALFEHAQRRLIEELGTKVNDHKVTAREQFIRGMQPQDSLGRYNPAAAGFVTGAAIGHLLERKEDVRQISARVDRRTLSIYAEIERHMELYRELRAALTTAFTPTRGQRPDRLAKVPDPTLSLELMAEPSRGPDGLTACMRLLKEFMDALAHVKVLPFRINAELTRQDLTDAWVMAKHGQRSSLRGQFAKIRRGISWVFAQDTLERELLAPLSFLMEDLLRQERLKRRKQPSKLPLRVSSAMAPEAFERLDTVFMDFMKRLDACSDDGLKIPVKKRVQLLLEQYRAAAALDNWEEAKGYLKVASALL